MDCHPLDSDDIAWVIEIVRWIVRAATLKPRPVLVGVIGDKDHLSGRANPAALIDRQIVENRPSLLLDLQRRKQQLDAIGRRLFERRT